VVSTPLKNMSSSVGMIIPNIWKNEKSSKPPTSTLWPFNVAMENYPFIDDFPS